MSAEAYELLVNEVLARAEHWEAEAEEAEFDGNSLREEHEDETAVELFRRAARARARANELRSILAAVLSPPTPEGGAK